MEIRRCYKLFLTDRKISGCSEATLRFYEYVIGKLLRYIEENELESSVESTHQNILPFFSHLFSKTYLPAPITPCFVVFVLSQKNIETKVRLVFPAAVLLILLWGGSSSFAPEK